MRSLGESDFATALDDAFTKVDEERAWSGEPKLVETDESLVLESKHPPPERGDHNSDGTGMRFVSVWIESRAASVGDMSDGRDGEKEAGGDS